MPETTILTSDEVAEIEARLNAWDEGPVSKQTFPASWAKVQALCQTVRALRAERLEIQRILESTALEDPTEGDDPPYSKAEIVEGVKFLLNMKNAARNRSVTLRKELAAVTQERDALRKKLNI